NAAKRKQMYSGVTSNGRQFSQDTTTNLLGYSSTNRFGPPLPIPSSTPSQQQQQYPSNQQYVPAHWGNNPPGQLEPPAKRHQYMEHDATSNPSFKVENSQDLEDSSPFTQSFLPVPPLLPQDTKNYNLSKDLMINLFLESDTPNATSTKSLMEARSTEIEMDVIIDEYSHTALHWASALARIPTVETLIRKGA